MRLTKIEKQVIEDYRTFRMTMGIKESREHTAKKNKLPMLEIEKILSFR